MRSVLLSPHKDCHPEDSDDATDIGLSSEEEAEDMEDVPHIRRKYQAPPPAPAPEPVPPQPPAPEPQTASIQVPIAALEQVKSAIDAILAGQAPSTSTQSAAPVSTQDVPEVPFSVPKIKRGDKVCSVCQRSFWSTDTLKRHLKTHTGKQKHVCPNSGCNRKLASKKSLDVHLETCGKEKVFKCKRGGCGKLFATKTALQAHLGTHLRLSEKVSHCVCGAGPFKTKKYKEDHYRYCDSNPDKVGPFPCPVAGCRRGKDNPFRRTRNLNAHLKDETASIPNTFRAFIQYFERLYPTLVHVSDVCTFDIFT